MQFELQIGEGADCRRQQLAPGREYTLGSAADNEVCIALPTVSRHHARLRVGNRLEVIDLDSRNGVHLQGRRAPAQVWLELAEDREWRIGSVPLRYRHLDAGDEELALVLDTPPPALAAPPAVTLAAGMIDRFTRRALPPLLRQAAAGATRLELARALGAALMVQLPLQALEIGAVDADELWFEASLGANAGPALDCNTTRVRYVVAPGHSADAYADLAELIDAVLALASPRQRSAGSDPSLTWPQPEPLDPTLRRLYRQAQRVAGSGAHVLIRGESGTGKELFARFLHQHGSNPVAPFVAVNCAAFAEDLLETELFGIEKGVATGVDARAGVFERAHGGVLFLDEIGDMAAATQARILRALQEREVWRLGAARARPAQVRVISATHRDLAAMRARGEFRDDLWHRIADWEVLLPPLRERIADIPNLALYFLARAAAARQVGVRGISRRALEALRAYDWPGNVRELEREMQRAALFLDHGGALTSAELRPAIRASEPAGDQSLASQLARAERRIIDLELARVDGDIERAAAQLGVSRATLYRRLAGRDGEATG